MTEIDTPGSSLFSISNKIALVTGGSRGIGLMIARGYVEAGATVYITSRTAGVCDAVANELSEIGRCYSLPNDLSTMEGVAHLVQEVSEREQKLHILVNNAGGPPAATFLELTDEQWQEAVQLNVVNVTENITVIWDMGSGNTAILTGEDGIFIVDTKSQELTDQ